MRLYYCDHYAIPLPEGHKFPMRKYRMVRDCLSAANGRFEFVQAACADTETIALAHDPAYVRDFVAGTVAPSIMRRIGFPWSEGLVRRTLASVGGTLASAADAMERGFGGNLAGGTHHAFYSEGAGFCVFNDIAIAIASLRNASRIRRAAVVDLDVHQGDGTAAMFSGDPDVLTLSVHGRNNFPFRKQQSTIDIDLPDGAGDGEYLAAVEAVLPRVFEFRPEVVFYQSGVDGLETDRLGRLALTHDGLRRRDRLVLESVLRRGIPLVITLGGGYSEPIDHTAQAHANTFRTAQELYDT